MSQLYGIINQHQFDLRQDIIKQPIQISILPIKQIHPPHRIIICMPIIMQRIIIAIMEIQVNRILHRIDIIQRLPSKNLNIGRRRKLRCNHHPRLLFHPNQVIEFQFHHRPALLQIRFHHRHYQHFRHRRHRLLLLYLLFHLQRLHPLMLLNRENTIHSLRMF